MTTTTQVRPGLAHAPCRARPGPASRHPGPARHRRAARRPLPRRAARARRLRRRRRVLRHLGLRHHRHAHARVGAARPDPLRALLLPALPAADARARAHGRRRRAGLGVPAEPVRRPADHGAHGYGRHAAVGQLRDRARRRRLLRRQRHDEPAAAHVVAVGRGAVLPRLPGAHGPRLAAGATRPAERAGRHRRCHRRWAPSRSVSPGRSAPRGPRGSPPTSAGRSPSPSTPRSPAPGSSPPVRCSPSPLSRIPVPTLAVARLVGAIGAVMLVVSAFAIHDSQPFPGVVALLPVTGTVLLILAGSHHTTGVSAALSTRPMVWLGDTSYSWYLWHWPLIVFTALLFPHRPALLVAAAAASRSSPRSRPTAGSSSRYGATVRRSRPRAGALSSRRWRCRWPRAWSCCSARTPAGDSCPRPPVPRQSWLPTRARCPPRLTGIARCPRRHRARRRCRADGEVTGGEGGTLRSQHAVVKAGCVNTDLEPDALPIRPGRRARHRAARRRLPGLRPRRRGHRRGRAARPRHRRDQPHRLPVPGARVQRGAQLPVRQLAGVDRRVRPGRASRRRRHRQPFRRLRAPGRGLAHRRPRRRRPGRARSARRPTCTARASNRSCAALRGRDPGHHHRGRARDDRLHRPDVAALAAPSGPRPSRSAATRPRRSGCPPSRSSRRSRRQYPGVVVHDPIPVLCPDDVCSTERDGAAGLPGRDPPGAFPARCCSPHGLEDTISRVAPAASAQPR